MSRSSRTKSHKVAASLFSILFFAVSIALIILNTRALSLIYKSRHLTQMVTISNTKNLIVLSLLPEHILLVGARAMLAIGAAGMIFGVLSMLLSLRPYVLAHVWVGIFAVIFAIPGLLSEYLSYYRSSTLVIDSSSATPSVGLARGWYSTGSWFCQTQNVFASPISKTFAQACKEDVATRVLILIYFVMSIGLIIIALTIRRDEVKLEPLKIETKRYNGGEMHNIPL